MVHTCPRCGLRFERDAEMRDHLDRDHGVDTEVVAPLHYTGRSGRRPTQADGRRVLVIANRALHSEQLPAFIREMAADAPSRFFLLVPADAGAGETPEEARRLAESRLRHLVDRLHDDGVDAEGVIGDADPFRAAEHVLGRERFNEIVLSTLPVGVNRWLAADLARRLERNFQVPVTQVEATV
jgi:GABA permease